jgi:tetratricopeptide (TPR) repeat protein
MLQKSLDLQPSSLAYNNLGTIYYKLGRYEDAATNYERAIKLKEEDYQVWRNLGEAYSWLPADIDKKISAYKRSIELGERQLKVNPKDARC